MADSSARKKMGFDTLKSCLDIYNFKNSFTTLPKSGAYMIDVGGRDTKVFCDMQTD
ncbi:hypothetical protein H6768_04245 [Candidatus Peribacteria bacterium]|nr:hypothetical protein [Candidatus Peribacteria bacterium]